MTLEKVNEYEKAAVFLLNLDGWDLEWCGGGFEHFDAMGKTPKGFDCRIEMKFRNKYYPEKLLEKSKLDKLLALGKDIVLLYFVADEKGNYLFWLNDIKMPTIEKKYCPATSLWNNKKELKEVYLLKEDLAARINWND
jgi:hypothetical protein|tara:strand:+ start:5661 stop:6074 length:414 start_codon:yes stop_codon:yes gene_type:complete